MTTDSESTPKAKLKTEITWTEWKAQWEAATDVPARVGLLHTGFDIDTSQWQSDEEERICFYLKEADAYPKPRHSQILSDKALTMLAQKVFEPAVKQRDGFFKEVTDALCHFFRVETKTFDPWQRYVPNRRQRSRLNNHTTEIVDQFLVYWALELWRGTRPDLKEYALELLATMHGRFVETLPILPGYAETASMQRAFRKEWKRFDAVALAKLEEIALREGKTLEAALVRRSEAAELLVIVRTALKEIERQERAEAAERMIAEGQRELQNLNS